MNIQGGCLCGGIRYEVSGPLTDVGNCHCSMCRRFHGAAFATYAKVGSSLGVPARGKLSDIALGPLDSDPGVRPDKHIFVGSKAGWFQINDTLPQHDEWPPGGR